VIRCHSGSKIDHVVSRVSLERSKTSPEVLGEFLPGHHWRNAGVFGFIKKRLKATNEEQGVWLTLFESVLIEPFIDPLNEINCTISRAPINM
jgi:hypothetical protein